MSTTTIEPRQRRYPRAPYSEPVQIFTWRDRQEAVAQEIGGGGIFLRCDDPLPEGKFVTLRLALPGFGRPFTVLGKVVRAVRGGAYGLARRGMGVRFLDLGATDRGRILDYVAARS